jgi:nephrocystin-4
MVGAAGYRLRIQQVVDLPMKQVQDRTFEFQLAVTLYDEALGVFYGNTCYSMHNPCNHKGAADPGVVDLNFSFDLYFHSAVSDPRYALACH